MRRIGDILLTLSLPIVVVTIVFVLTADRWDTTLNRSTLVYITATCTLGVAAMLVYTRQWTLIGRGLVGLMIGDALLYARFSGVDAVAHAWVLDITRAAFVVGCTYLAIGIPLWIRHQQHGDAVIAREDMP